MGVFRVSVGCLWGLLKIYLETAGAAFRQPVGLAGMGKSVNPLLAHVVLRKITVGLKRLVWFLHLVLLLP